MVIRTVSLYFQTSASFEDIQYNESQHKWVPIDDFDIGTRFGGDCEDTTGAVYHALLFLLKKHDWNSLSMQNLRKCAFLLGIPVVFSGFATDFATGTDTKQPHSFGACISPERLYRYLYDKPLNTNWVNQLKLRCGLARHMDFYQKSAILDGTILTDPFYSMIDNRDQTIFVNEMTKLAKNVPYKHIWKLECQICNVSSFYYASLHRRNIVIFLNGNDARRVN